MKLCTLLFASALSGIFFLQCTEKSEPKGAALEGADETAKNTSNPILELLKSDRTGIDFSNKIIETYENNITNNINTYNGGGLCIADINNDELPDIYFIGSNGPNKMYLNEGNLHFKDITSTSGLASEEGFETAVTAVDINADGWLDFYVCRAGVEENDARRNQLYINNKDLSFTEQGKAYGIDDKSASTGANFFDFDNDGDLDLYLLNYPSELIWVNKINAKLGPDNKYHPILEPQSAFDSDRFYRNDNGKFTEISKAAGVWNLAYGLSVSVSDFNQDGYPDVYVGNDFIQPDQLLINNKKGGFTNQIDQYFKHSSQHTMGTDLTDFNNDGLVDLYAVDMLPTHNARSKSYNATNGQGKQTAIIQNGYFDPVVRNVLQRNNGNGTFSDMGCMANVFKTDWSWSGLLFDMDNDGLRDIHVTNGYRRDIANRDFTEFTLPELQKKNSSFSNLRQAYPNFDDFLKLIPSSPKLLNFCYKNTGDYGFEEMSGKWMSMEPSWSCGAAWGDLDKDGDLDLVVNNLEQPAFVYENKGSAQTGNNYLQVKLQGSGQNLFAIGASVLLEYNNGQVQYGEMYTNRGIFSTTEHLLHFGMGKIQQVDKVTVRWPNGKTQIMTNVPVNQRLLLRQSDANGPVVASILPKSTSYNYFTPAKGLAFQHIENEHNDFEVWPLNPWKVTELGPYATAGDINGDGLDDVFIGNSFDQAGTLAVQKLDGSFSPVSTAVWEADKIYEDHGACFFDADMDKDLDIFVVSGGAESPNTAAWQCRLYINTDGKGNFMRATNAIPLTAGAGGRVTAHDYDQDGDMDIFIGGRVTPGKWPLTPSSFILRNDRNKFTDVTSSVSPEFGSAGMITDLQWLNLDSDPALELVACGEWMPVSVFKMKDGRLVNASAAFGLDQSQGLWNRLATADLDGDGDMDLVTGNLGLNTRFTASETAPFRCFAADFDKNSILDPIMAYSENGNLFPLVQKDVLVKHIPSLKKKFLKATVYSQATMDEVYPQSDLDAALNLRCNTLAHCWWENKDGKFIRHELPRAAQISVAQGILIHDFTGDGQLDILLAGNKYGMEVETNPCDAGIGALLGGDGKGGFNYIHNTQTGFWARGEVRDLALLRGAGGSHLVMIANNNQPVQTYKCR